MIKPSRLVCAGQTRPKRKWKGHAFLYNFQTRGTLGQFVVNYLIICLYPRVFYSVENMPLLEIACFNKKSALQAAKGGADRIE